MTQMINFAHANGFPAGSYTKLFASLSDTYSFIALPQYAHNPRFPLVNNWEHQVDELIDFVEAQGTSADAPVVAIGHSFGAVISYMACCRRPDLFSALIMLDPPLITGAASWLFTVAKHNRLINKLTPAGQSALRKSKWHKTTDLVDYFQQRALFRQMDPECIRDYVNAVIEEDGEHKTLGFDVATEANIFRTIPTHLHRFYGQLNIPSALVTGENTKVCVPLLRNRFLKGNPTMQHAVLEQGGHMFPLEYPCQTAQIIRELMTNMGT